MSEHRRITKLLKRIVMTIAVLGVVLLCARLQSDRQNHVYAATGGLPQIKTVFLILMENQEWQDMTATATPYIRNSLVPMGAHAENYHNAPGGFPHSLPNYLLLEAGDDFGIRDNLIPPVAPARSVTNHLVTLLNRKSPPISWRAYAEGIPGNNCPLQEDSAAKYVPWHEPMLYFDDVTNNSQFCIDHYRPYSQLATDLQSNTVARYNFITPNLCNDMHDRCPPINNDLKQGDDWLSREVPRILESQAYRDGGALFITWDEPGPPNGTGAIGLIVLSPFAKVGFQNATAYTHLSTVKTLADIFEVDTQALGRAATATNLADLFTIPAASDFTMTGPSSGTTVTAGQAASFSIRVTPQGGSTFANGVTFTAASGLPSGANASFNPPSIAAGSGASNTTLTITTTARSWIVPPSPPKGSPWWFELVAACLAALGIWAWSANKQRGPARPSLALATILLVLYLASCGGGTTSNNPPPHGGTPAGTYPITVSATSGTVSHTTNVTLIVY